MSYLKSRPIAAYLATIVAICLMDCVRVASGRPDASISSLEPLELNTAQHRQLQGSTCGYDCSSRGLDYFYKLATSESCPLACANNDRSPNANSNCQACDLWTLGAKPCFDSYKGNPIGCTDGKYNIQRKYINGHYLSIPFVPVRGVEDHALFNNIGNSMLDWAWDTAKNGRPNNFDPVPNWASPSQVMMGLNPPYYRSRAQFHLHFYKARNEIRQYFDKSCVKNTGQWYSLRGCGLKHDEVQMNSGHCNSSPFDRWDVQASFWVPPNNLNNPSSIDPFRKMYDKCNQLVADGETLKKTAKSNFHNSNLDCGILVAGSSASDLNNGRRGFYVGVIYGYCVEWQQSTS